METISERVRGKRFFVTGATGLIGKNLTAYLLQNGADVLALTRRPVENLNYILGTVEDLPEIPGDVDYIIHGASATASAFFVEHPVETIQTAVLGTQNVLKLAREKRVKGLVYLSSMEVYGYPEKGHRVTENEVAGFDPTSPRNCYPISKQLCESMCCAYAREYGVPAKIVRLTQTFGAEMKKEDKRLFAEMMRCAIEKRDIVLHTKGETEHAYLFTDDAAQAILTVLFKGAIGEAYSAADPDSYCSIAQLAETVAEMYGIRVCYELGDVQKLGYANTKYMDLDVSKLEALGWRAKTDLKTAIEKTIRGMQE